MLIDRNKTGAAQAKAFWQHGLVHRVPGTATGIRRKGEFGSPKQDVGQKAACSREAD